MLKKNHIIYTVLMIIGVIILLVNVFIFDNSLILDIVSLAFFCVAIVVCIINVIQLENKMTEEKGKTLKQITKGEHIEESKVVITKDKKPLW